MSPAAPHAQRAARRQLRSRYAGAQNRHRLSRLAPRQVRLTAARLLDKDRSPAPDRASGSRPRKMSDLTICSTWQPTAWAASLAVRVESDNSTTSQPNPRCCKIACTLRALALNSCGILRSLSHLVHMNVFCDGLPAAA